MSAWLDIGQVAPAALDADHPHLVTVEVAQYGFDRGVSPAVLHQARVSPEQPRAVCSECQVLNNPSSGVVLNHFTRVRFVPQVLHSSSVPACGVMISLERQAFVI